MSDKKTAQERFDELYISGNEIQRVLGVQRSSILAARRKGLLPEPVVVPGIRAFIWERDKATPCINAWKASLNFKRGITA